MAFLLCSVLANLVFVENCGNLEEEEKDSIMYVNNEYELNENVIV